MVDTYRVFWALSASRGIGLGFVQALAQNPENAVLATCRTPSEATELQEIAGTLFIPPKTRLSP
jgi:NAD(P)-dependent dehydrogenase (short-subunit alcohol dehydrogenase family)